MQETPKSLDRVAEGPLGDRRGEPLGVADDPVGHIAAVAAADDPQAPGSIWG